MQVGSGIFGLLSMKRGAAYIVVEAILICNEKEAKVWSLSAECVQEEVELSSMSQ